MALTSPRIPLGTSVLEAGLRDDTSGCRCVCRSCVVPHVLFGPCLGEGGDSVLEAVALAQLGGDGEPVAGAGMRSGQSPPADTP
jgi:hypothetical protein